MTCGKAEQDVAMNRTSMFKRRSNDEQIEIETTTSRPPLDEEDTANNTISIFRKPQQEKKKKGLVKRLLFFTLKSKSNKDSLPSLKRVNELTWSLSSDGSESSSGRRSFTSSWGHLSVNSIVSSPLSVTSVGRKISRSGSVSPMSSLSSAQAENLNEDFASLQATLNEFQKNELEYRNICDEYEAFVQEQDAEIKEKESKIMHLMQTVQIMDSLNAEETQKCDYLRKDLSEYQSRCADHEYTIRAKDIKINKRERELQQQKRVYTTLLFESQAATQKLQETIARHESHVESLKAQLEAASKREGLQILQIETFNEELEAVSKRYRLDSAKADEKTREDKRRWTMWEE